MYVIKYDINTYKHTPTCTRTKNTYTSLICAITSKIIIKAWKKLYSSQIVLGPSEDGGFWLIGLSQNHRIKNLFYNIDWNKNDTLEQVEYNINSSVKISYVDTLVDID